jgi:predicted DCC family thiol-disulfide oxidoreductase YuxK
MLVRIFGSADCPVCQYIKTFCCDPDCPFDWDFVDANADDTQTLCDQHGVDALPHVQILDDNGNVIWQDAGQHVTYSDIVIKHAALE